MTFAEVVSLLEKDTKGFIRRESWGPDVVVGIVENPDVNLAKHFVVSSRFGVVPWIPNMIEMLTNHDWEFIPSERLAFKDRSERMVIVMGILFGIVSAYLLTLGAVLISEERDYVCGFISIITGGLLLAVAIDTFLSLLVK